MIKDIKAGLTRDGACFLFVTDRLKHEKCPVDFAKWRINSVYLEVVVALQFNARGLPDQMNNHFKYALEDVQYAFSGTNFAITPLGRAKIFYFLAFISRKKGDMSSARRYAGEAHRHIIGSKQFVWNLERINRFCL